MAIEKKDSVTLSTNQLIKQVIRWCERHGIVMVGSVEGYTEFFFVKHNESQKKNVRFLYQEIRYNKYLPKKFILYSLLHELGHRTLILQGYDHPSSRVFNKTFHSLQEEMMAWNEGLRWAARLGIPINRPGYRMYACRALRTYVVGFFNKPQETKMLHRAVESVI